METSGVGGMRRAVRMMKVERRPWLGGEGHDGDWRDGRDGRNIEEDGFLLGGGSGMIGGGQRGMTEARRGGHVGAVRCVFFTRRLLSTHAFEHFRKTFSVGSYYSAAIPRPSLPTLVDALTGTRDIGHPLPLALEDSQYTSPALMPPPAAGHDAVHDEYVSLILGARKVELKDQIVFTVVHKSPSKRKLVKPPGSNLCSEDMAVSIHDIRQVWDVEGDPLLCVAVCGVRADGLDIGSTNVLSRRHLEVLPNLSKDFQEWCAHDEGIVYLPTGGWPEDLATLQSGRAARLLTDLVNCGGIPGSSVDYLVDPSLGDAHLDLQVLDSLKRAGYVCTSPVQLPEEFGGTVNGWRLTEYGLNSVAAFEMLKNPKPAVRPREGIKDKDMNTFELLCKMQDHGWLGRLYPPRHHARPIPYDPSASEPNKIWYFHGGKKSISAAYLKCLLTATSPVDHTGAAKSFKAHLALPDDCDLEFAIEDDTGCGHRIRGRICDTSYARCPVPNCELWVSSGIAIGGFRASAAWGVSAASGSRRRWGLGEQAMTRRR